MGWKMPKKFDTNPLDPDFPEKAKAAAQPGPDVEAYRAPAAPPSSPYSTAEFPVRPTAPPSVTEDETQRFDEAQFNAYAFQGGQVPAAYKQSPFAEMNLYRIDSFSLDRIVKMNLFGLHTLRFDDLCRIEIIY